VLFFSGTENSEAATTTTEEPRPSASRTDRRCPVDHSPSKPVPGTSSLQRPSRLQQQQQQSSSPHHRASGDRAIVHDDEDVFVVGPPGGLFQSSTDPVVSIYIPPSAVTHTITLTMQVTCSLNTTYSLQPTEINHCINVTQFTMLFVHTQISWRSIKGRLRSIV